MVIHEANRIDEGDIVYAISNIDNKPIELVGREVFAAFIYPDSPYNEYGGSALVFFVDNEIDKPFMLVSVETPDEAVHVIKNIGLDFRGIYKGESK